MYDQLVKDLREGAEFLECSTPGIKNSFAKMCRNAADAIEELSRENESLAKSVNEASEILRKRWVPVTERLPENDDFVLVWKDEKPEGFACICRFGKDGWAFKNITHWMPCPEPPKKDVPDNYVGDNGEVER